MAYTTLSHKVVHGHFSHVRRDARLPHRDTKRRQAAQHLHVSRRSLSELANERTGVAVDMAIRLTKAFGSTPETWLGLQMAYDLWQARGRIGEIKIERIESA